MALGSKETETAQKLSTCYARRKGWSNCALAGSTNTLFVPGWHIRSHYSSSEWLPLLVAVRDARAQFTYTLLKRHTKSTLLPDTLVYPGTELQGESESKNPIIYDHG